MSTREEITRKVIMKSVNPITVVLGALIVILLILHIVKIGKQNQTYDQFIVCVLSVPALDRDQHKINDCYQKAEQSTHTKINHY